MSPGAVTTCRWRPSELLGIFGGAGLLALAIAWLIVAGHAYKVARANPGRALRVE